MHGSSVRVDPRLPGEDAVGGLLGDPHVVGRIRLPETAGVTTDWPAWLDPQVRDAYQALGIQRPWRHQVRAAQLAHDGQHVLLSTGTASGKSAAFGMPGLTAALRPAGAAGQRGPSVLYLAPTKALAHDQLAGLRALGLASLRAGTLDGDTPDDERAWVRAHARWVVTNPDMLHRGILPSHDRWRGLLRSLSLVVVDEAHVYRGVFGAHVALVLRRLRRVARSYGADPTFVLASATMADGAATGARLLGAEVAVVDTDDSARGAVELVLWDPRAGTMPGTRSGPAAAGAGWDDGPLPDHPGAELAGGGGPDAAPAPSTLAEAATVMARLVGSGVRTLTFARSRRAVEVLAGRAREACGEVAPVRAYRGGYLPEERRALEADLRAGRLLGLAATNALELGIDVSGLDAVVLAGWPGTRSSFWQQVGRAGRRGETALAVLIPREDPLDRYVLDHPETLTGNPLESTVIDPGNPYVLAGHLCSAAAEAPLRLDEVATWFGDGSEELCASLAARGLLRRRRDGWYWTERGRPADLVDLRGTAGGPVRVIEQGTGRLLGTVDWTAAPAAVHEGAIYVHQGATYEIQSLDLVDRVAEACATTTELSTHPRSRSEVRIESVRRVTSWGDVRLSFGEVVVTDRVTSYLIRRWPSGQVLSQNPLDLPETTLQTLAMWWTIPGPVLTHARIESDRLAGALHALEHAAIGILPLLATCDRWDLGGMSTPVHPQTGEATIVVHDGQPGGSGFAERGFSRAARWLAATAAAIEACPCATGCPGCVQSPKCGNGNEPLDKDAALRLARALLLRIPDSAGDVCVDVSDRAGDLRVDMTDRH